MDDLTMSAEQKTTDFTNDCIALVDFSVMNGVAEGIADGVESVEREVQKEVDTEYRGRRRSSWTSSTPTSREST